MVDGCVGGVGGVCPLHHRRGEQPGGEDHPDALVRRATQLRDLAHH